MAIALSASQLADLLNYLAKDLPKSFKVHGELKNHLLGKWPGLTYWVDAWPDPKVVFVKPEIGKTKSAYVEHFYNVYCTDEDALSDMLREPGLVDWSQDLMFAGIDGQYRALVETMGERNGKVLALKDDNSYVYTATWSSLKRIECPANLTLSSLTEDSVPTIVDQWRYSLPGMETYVQALLQTFPSCCLTDENGQLVGYVLGEEEDVAGMLWVEPPFRGQGLAGVLMTALARKYPHPPLSITDVDNIPSQRLHERIGYQRIPDYFISWLRFTDPN